MVVISITLNLLESSVNQRYLIPSSTVGTEKVLQIFCQLKIKPGELWPDSLFTVSLLYLLKLDKYKQYM